MLVAVLVRPASVSQVTIAPRGRALGYVRQAPDDDPLLETVSEREGEIVVCLAGSEAEVLQLGERSIGAAHDFEQVWAIGRRMVLAGRTELGAVEEHPGDLTSLADGSCRRQPWMARRSAAE